MKCSLTLVTAFLFCLGPIQAQEAVTSSGGEASGGGGTASYSVGQVVYTSTINSSGTASDGVQQPFEIFISVGIEDPSIRLALKAFPNPTSSLLSLTTQEFQNLSFQLLDVRGKLIKESSLLSDSTTIDMNGLVAGSYVLHVINKNKLVKAFKILKN